MIAPGATIAEGQAVMELETDKAVVEVPSSVSGKVKDVLVKQGEKVKVGQVIFTLDNGSRAAQPQASKPSSEKSEKKAHPAPVTSQPVQAPQPKTPAPRSAPAASAVPTETAEVAEFKLPELGENITQGDLVRLMISPGAQVSEGQPVMELETDKAVVEVPSSLTGIVKDVLVNQGEKIKVGQVVFTLEPGATSQHAQHPSRVD